MFAVSRLPLKSSDSQGSRQESSRGSGSWEKCSDGLGKASGVQFGALELEADSGGPRLQRVGLHLPPDPSSSRLQLVFREDTSREGLLLSFVWVNGGG